MGLDPLIQAVLANAKPGGYVGHLVVTPGGLGLRGNQQQVARPTRNSSQQGRWTPPDDGRFKRYPYGLLRLVHGKSHAKVAVAESSNGTPTADTVLVPAVLAARWLHHVLGVRHACTAWPASDEAR